MYEQKTRNYKIYSKVIIVVFITFIMALFFIGGVFTANSEWYKNKFNSKSQQAEEFNENLDIKSLKPYDTALFKKAKTQTEMNIASSERYKHYHQYYEKVVNRIKNYDFNDDSVKSAVLEYIDGYEKRKAEIENIMFSDKDKPVEESGYGSMFSMSYSCAMLEFDRQELLTYRMILSNMYYPISIQDINVIFEE